MNVLSPGEKIKRLRREIGLKQEELTDDQITRSLISMIENGKRNLSVDTAKIIAKKFNEYCTESCKSITSDYLMESKEEQVQKIIDTQLVNINILIANYRSLNHNQIYDIFDKMLSLATEWSIKEHYAKTLIKRGEFNLNISKYSDALMDFFNSLDFYLQNQNHEIVSFIYNKIGSCFMLKNFIEEGLLYFNKSNTVALENNTPNQKYIEMLNTFNTIISYRKSKKFDLVFKYITLFKELEYIEDSYYDEVTLMEANTYRDLSNYDKAKKLYEKLLPKEDKLSSDLLLLLFNNLTILYRALGNHKEAVYYSELATSLTEKEDLNITPTIYYELAKCHRDLNEINKALELLQKGLHLAKKLSNIDVVINIKLLLSDIYKDNLNNLDEAEEQLLDTEEMLKHLGARTKFIEVYSKIAKFYCHINQTDRCIRYLDKIHA